MKLSIVILRSPCCIQSVKYTAYRNRPFEHCQVLKGFIVADIRLHMGETSAGCSLIVEGSEILQHGYMSQPRPSKAPSAELEVLFFPLPAHNQSTPVLQQDQLVEQPATSRPTDICSLGCVPDSSAAPPAAHIADRLLLSNTPQPPATCHSSDQHLTEAEIEVALHKLYNGRSGALLDYTSTSAVLRLADSQQRQVQLQFTSACVACICPATQL